MKKAESQCSNYNTNEEVTENVIPKLNSSMEERIVQVTNIYNTILQFYCNLTYMLIK